MTIWLLLALAAPNDPCATTTKDPPTKAGQPFTVTWTIPAGSTADGFLIALDDGVPVVAEPLPTPKACPDGSRVYQFRMVKGVAKGRHTLTITSFTVLMGKRVESPPTIREFQVRR